MQGAGCRVQGAGCRVQGAGCRVQGAGCEAHRVKKVQFSVQEQSLYINVQGFQSGLAFEAHRLLYHSTLGLRVTEKRRREVLPVKGIEPSLKYMYIYIHIYIYTYIHICKCIHEYAYRYR